MDDFAKARIFIINAVKTVQFDARATWLNSESLEVIIDGLRTVLTFTRATLDDLQSAISAGIPTAYSEGFKSKVCFKIYIALGLAGMATNLQMSDLMLKDERDWLPSVRLHVRFDADLAQRLYVKLKEMATYFKGSLDEHGDIAEYKAAWDVISSMTGFYEEHQHLNSQGEQDSLSYLKAAAVLVIKDMEDKKMSVQARRVKARYDQNIFSIIQKFEVNPWDRIKLPETLGDLLAERGAEQRTPPAVTDERGDARLDPLLARIDPRFVERRKGAWQALESDNADNVSQAANSMVELLDQVIGSVCGETPFAEFLRIRLRSDSQCSLVIATRTFIAETKSNLHAVKHHTVAQSKLLAETLFQQAESVMRLILE